MTEEKFTRITRSRFLEKTDTKKLKITRITRNWQITVPKNLRAGLKIGDYVVVEKLRRVR